MRVAAALWVALGGWLALWPGSAWAEFDPEKIDRYIAVVLTEAAGEGYRGKVAVAEVLRNRGWKTSGFCGLQRKNLPAFLKKNARQRAAARRAIRAALAGSNLSGGATHYENVRRFGKPKWASRMAVTARLGKHTFYKGG